MIVHLKNNFNSNNTNLINLNRVSIIFFFFYTYSTIYLMYSIVYYKNINFLFQNKAVSSQYFNSLSNIVFAIFRERKNEAFYVISKEYI